MKDKEKKKKLIITGAIILILLIIGVSYAYWQLIHTQTNTNVVKTGCFNITFTSGSGINMNNTLPITDIEGKTTTPHTFTITNTCGSPASYQINLERLDTSTLDSEHVKAVLNTKPPRLLTKYDEVETTIVNATNSYKLYKGILKPLETKTYDLRIWMDHATTTIQGSSKSFSSKIVIIAVPKLVLPTLMSVTSSPTEFFGGKLGIVKNTVETITFMNTKEVPEDALGWADVSSSQNGSVIAWYKDGATSGRYDVYIGGKGGVAANPSSSYLFYYLQNLTSLDLTYFDTSTAINMNRAFSTLGSNSASCTLDLSNLDVSGVTNMSEMFTSSGYNNANFTIGNLDDWDVSNVTNMSNVFSSLSRGSTTFTLGDLSYWDVSNVTNMSNMFSAAGDKSTTFTLGDLSNWDVSNVTNMSGMFSDAGYKNTSFNIGDLSNWDVSSVTKMSSMFSGAGYSSTVFNLGDLSKWNVFKVDIMENMFSNAGYSSTNFRLDLSKWDVSKVTNMNGMFSNTGRNSTILTLGDLSAWDVSSVTKMSNMFQYTGYSNPNFNLGDINNWITSNVGTMNQMFMGACYSCIDFTLNISDWDVSGVTDMERMFFYAGYSGTNLNFDLSSWDISNVTQMSNMFENTKGLRDLHLDNWALPTAVYSSMFTASNNNPAPNNLKIYVKNPTVESWLNSIYSLPANAQVILLTP